MNMFIAQKNIANTALISFNTFSRTYLCMYQMLNFKRGVCV